MMPKVMEPGTLAATGVGDATLKQQHAEDATFEPWPIVMRGKEEGIVGALAEVGGVLLQALDQRHGWRDQSITTELALENGDDALVEIDICHSQMQHLADPEATAVQ